MCGRGPHGRLFRRGRLHLLARGAQLTPRSRARADSYMYANRVCLAKYICVTLTLRPGASRRLLALRPQPPPGTSPSVTTPSHMSRGRRKTRRTHIRTYRHYVHVHGAPSVSPARRPPPSSPTTYRCSQTTSYHPTILTNSFSSLSHRPRAPPRPARALGPRCSGVSVSKCEREHKRRGFRMEISVPLMNTAHRKSAGPSRRATC